MHNRNEDRSLNELLATLVCKVDDINGFLSKHKLPGLLYGKSHSSLLDSADQVRYGESRAVAIEVVERILATLRGPREILLDLSFQVCGRCLRPRPCS